MLVSDLLHEIEIGNWKALFIHLMRILHLIKNAIAELNKRYNNNHPSKNIQITNLVY
jgi:hypothetical protein